MATTRRVDRGRLWRLDGGVTQLFLRKMKYAGLLQDTDYPEYWTENPIGRILSDDHLFAQADAIAADMPEIRGKDGSAPAIFWARAQVIAQQQLWHHGYNGRQTGPEGDGIPKTLRKLWYAGHKSAYQRISERCQVWRESEAVMNDKSANQALSQVYGAFIDTREVTYLDSFIVDGSRMFYDNRYPLPSPYSNILICVEKDAAYADMVSIGKALGARCVVSGGGKMGKAGTENMLRTCFSHWYDGEVGNTIDWQNKLYVIVISDWDYDGEHVIAPTFVEQIFRYVNRSNVEWMRIGIKPEHMQQFGRDVIGDPDVAYFTKNSTNSAYSEWCAGKGIYIYQDQLFEGLVDIMENHRYDFTAMLERAKVPSSTVDLMYPEWGTEAERKLADLVDDWRWEGKQGLHPALRFLTHKQLVALYQELRPLGFELDAIRRVEYAEVVAGAMRDILDWDELVNALSDEAAPRAWDVAHDLTRTALDLNKQYQGWGEEIQKIRDKAEKDVEQLEAARRQMADRFHTAIQQRVELFEEDDRVFEDDPDVDENLLGQDLKVHYDEDDYTEHWQPFDQRDRERLLADLIRDERKASLGRLANCTMDYEFTEEGEDES